MSSGSTKTVEAHSLIGIVRTAALIDAAKLMVKRDIGALGVYETDGKRLLGIVTDRDLTRSVASGRDPEGTSVREVMTTPIVKVDGPISDAAARRLMRHSHTRHLIVDDNGSHRIVSLRDIA